MGIDRSIQSAEQIADNRLVLSTNADHPARSRSAQRESATSPARVRVVLADMSRLTQELIRQVLEREPGILVVCDARDVTLPLEQLVDQTEAEVVIVGSDAAGLLAEGRELLNAHARLRMLAVSADGREAHVFGLQPYDFAVEEFSPGFVLDVVSSAERGTR